MTGRTAGTSARTNPGRFRGAAASLAPAGGGGGGGSAPTLAVAWYRNAANAKSFDVTGVAVEEGDLVLGITGSADYLGNDPAPGTVTGLDAWTLLDSKKRVAGGSINDGFSRLHWTRANADGTLSVPWVGVNTYTLTSGTVVVLRSAAIPASGAPFENTPALGVVAASTEAVTLAGLTPEDDAFVFRFLGQPLGVADVGQWAIPSTLFTGDPLADRWLSRVAYGHNFVWEWVPGGDTSEEVIVRRSNASLPAWHSFDLIVKGA